VVSVLEVKIGVFDVTMDITGIWFSKEEPELAKYLNEVYPRSIAGPENGNPWKYIGDVVSKALNGKIIKFKKEKEKVGVVY